MFGEDSFGHDIGIEISGLGVAHMCFHRLYLENMIIYMQRKTT